MRTAHQWGGTPSPTPGSAVATEVSLRIFHPLSLHPRRRLAVISRRKPWPPSQSLVASSFPSNVAKFPRPRPVWSLAACPVLSSGRSSWCGNRPMGDAHCSTTPQSPQKSASVPCSPPQNSVASAEGSLSPSPLPCPSWESSCHLRHCVVCDTHRDELRWTVQVRFQTGRCRWACLRIFGAHHLHHPLTSCGAHLGKLKHEPFLPLSDPLHLRPQFPLEHQAMEYLRPVLLVLLSASGG